MKMDGWDSCLAGTVAVLARWWAGEEEVRLGECDYDGCPGCVVRNY
jgi:hypothetical protein